MADYKKVNFYIIILFCFFFFSFNHYGDWLFDFFFNRDNLFANAFDHFFNLNTIIQELLGEIPEAGIDGGGHECAGSLKFLEGLSKKVLQSFASKVAGLKAA